MQSKKPGPRLLLQQLGRGRGQGQQGQQGQRQGRRQEGGGQTLLRELQRAQLRPLLLRWLVQGWQGMQRAKGEGQGVGPASSLRRVKKTLGV